MIVCQHGNHQACCGECLGRAKRAEARVKELMECTYCDHVYQHGRTATEVEAHETACTFSPLKQAEARVKKLETDGSAYIAEAKRRVEDAESRATELSAALQAEQRAHAETASRLGVVREALREALDEWEYAASYKGDYLREKHGDLDRIAELRAAQQLENIEQLDAALQAEQRAHAETASRLGVVREVLGDIASRLGEHEQAWDHTLDDDDCCEVDCRACEYQVMLRDARAALSGSAASSRNRRLTALGYETPTREQQDPFVRPAATPEPEGAKHAINCAHYDRVPRPCTCGAETEGKS